MSNHEKACREEIIVSLFFLISICIVLYFFVSSTELRKNRNIDFKYISIYIFFKKTIFLRFAKIKIANPV